MKILHALLGYLAVAALPFHAFAYPLAAIDCDGYVNTTQNHIQVQVDGALMKHVLGTTHVENHGDSALMKRVTGDIIEARQLLIVPEILIVFAIVADVTLSILWVLNDDPKRTAFTQDTISGTISRYPKYNWVICHSPYSIGFDGVEGTDWGYTHHELGISFGRTIGYDLYWATSGTFYRYGDGGFINWAYNGNILGTDDGGATVHFGTP